MLSLISEVLRHALLGRAAPVSPELRQRRALGLQKQHEVLALASRDSAARDDLDGPELLARLEVTPLLLAGRDEVLEVFLVRHQRAGGVLQVTLRICLLLQLLGFPLFLRSQVLLSVRNL